MKNRFPFEMEVNIINLYFSFFHLHQNIMKTNRICVSRITAKYVDQFPNLLLNVIPFITTKSIMTPLFYAFL